VGETAKTNLEPIGTSPPISGDGNPAGSSAPTLCAWAANIFRDGALYVRQQKTGAELIIPVHADLQASISETAGMTSLVTGVGKPFTAAGCGNWFREQCDMANLRHCSALGLRKAAARRLAGRLH
jgi:hypothetical protein